MTIYRHGLSILDVVIILVIVGVIVVIAVPNPGCGYLMANESHAASTLRSGVFPGQIQFAAGAYRDPDGDGRGECGFLPWLSGASVPPGSALQVGELAFLGRDLDTSPGVSNGYRFQIFLPDGRGGAIDLDGALADPEAFASAGGDLREHFFVAYAWPERPGDTGRFCYVITQQGQVASCEPEHMPGAEIAWDFAFAPVDDSMTPRMPGLPANWDRWAPGWEEVSR